MQQGTPFYRLGQWVYTYRLVILILWILLVLGCLPFLPQLVTPFKSTGFTDELSAGAKADAYLNKHLQYNKEKILIIYRSKQLAATDPRFLKSIKQSLSGLKTLPIEHTIFYPSKENKQISKDKHTAIAIISFKTKTPLSSEAVENIQKLIKKPSKMTMLLGGEPIFINHLEKQTQEDLYQSDAIAAPVSIIILILVFGTLVSAMIPLFLGGACALLILTSLYFLGQILSLSIFTLNIALLLGLCLSLDYALFVINRFRDELHQQKDVSLAIATTCATAGKAVFFSGLAIFISLSALLMFPINILFSVGIGGLVAVFLAVIMAITLLPAVLGILQHKVNALALFKKKEQRIHSGWQWLATKVVNHPYLYFIFVLILLLILGYPFLSVKLGISDYHILPKEAEGRQFFSLYQDKFNENELTPILVVVTTSKGNIASRANLSKLYDLVETIKANPRVDKINSIVTLNDSYTEKKYYRLFQMKPSLQPASVRNFLKETTTKQITLITVVSKYATDSTQTKALINELSQIKPDKPLSMQITGVPVNNNDVLKRIKLIFPYAIAWIMVLTYLILLLLLRSIFLPLKAILMNVISLSASYGVLVFIFQEGHFHTWLQFDPQGMLDVSLLIIIFCALFGFSMDYEVFLLTRIKECHDRYGDNKKSIIFGIERSASIITSAAVIVIFLCGAFMFADVLMVKEFGLGIAVAIFVDAFLVRSLLVPATMSMVKQINWYCPAWLKKILPKE